MKLPILLFCLALAAFIGSFSIMATASTSMMKQTEEMVGIVDEENLQLKKWELLVKDQVDRTHFSTFKKQLQSFFPSTSFMEEKTEEAIKLTANHYHRETATSESFTIVIPNDQDQPVQVSYRVSGEKWDNRILNQYSSKLVPMTKELFTNKFTTFSCVQAMSSDKISRVYFFEKLQEKLSVQPLTHIEENGFVVLSGYTPEWEPEIPAIDGPMNIQVAAREAADGQTVITIGTPIIMTEY